MKRSEINPMPEYFDRYINCIEDIDLFNAFDNSLAELKNLDTGALVQLKTKTYLPDKWTVNEIVQHITDIERLLSAGVLRFARNEENYIISFDEVAIAAHSKANAKDITKLIDELMTVRAATIALYKSFTPEDFFKSGINWKYRINVLAMGFNILGHQTHHLHVIQEKYIPLLYK